MLQKRIHGPVMVFRQARKLMGRPFYFTASFLVDGLLVDSGCAHTEAELLAALAETPPHTVVNTHGHEDHVAANAALEKRHGARLFAPAPELATLATPKNQLPLKPYQLLMWGRPEPSRPQPLPEWIETPRYRFLVVPTPGHSLGHVSFFEPNQGWLFCGDAFIGGRDRALREDYEIWDIIASLKKMAALPLSALFAGSGSVYQEPLPVIREKIAYLEELGDKVLTLAGRGLSPQAIARRLLGRNSAIGFITLGHFSPTHLVRSYLRRPGEG